MKKQLLLLLFLQVTACFYAQHNVKVKVGKQIFTVSGDTTKYNFKSTIAKLEKRFGDAADLKLKAIDNGEITELKTAYYDIACYYSADGLNEKSIKYLQQSIANGWQDMAALEYDKDLKSLRATKYWSKISSEIDAYYKSNNREIAKLYNADQEPRISGKKVENLAEEDLKRRERILELKKKGAIKSADDFYKAAMIMHHGNSVDDYKLAHKLVKKGFKKKNPNIMAPWLVAASKDRLLLKQGKKQWYATQGLTFKNGKIALDPNKIDTTAVKDKRRKQLNAPSLEKIRGYIKAFSQNKEDNQKN